MARAAGLPKTGGRKRGTPNKSTLGLQASLEAQGVDIVALLAETLPALSADKRADVLIDLMNYLYPKRKAVEVSSTNSINDPQVVVYLPDNGRSADSPLRSQLLGK